MAVAALSWLSTNAIAGNLIFSLDEEPVIAAAQVEDWSGLYLGGKYINVFDGTQSYYFNDVYDSDRNMAGSMYGGFVGYNFQSDRFVYGAEIAYSVGEVNRPDGGRFDNRHTSFIDAKLRGGYVLGSALVYGTVGWAGSNWQENVLGDVTTSGISYGVGIDYRVWNRIFIGAEYVHRDLTSENFSFQPNEHFTSSLDAFEIRIGMGF